MFVLIYSVFIYFYANVEANRIKERVPHETFTFYDHEPPGSWANAVAYNSGGSAASSAASSGVLTASSAASSGVSTASSAASSGASADRPSASEPVPRSCGSAAVPVAPVARFPFGSGVRSPVRSFRKAVSSASASGGARAHAFVYDPMELRRDCHESAWRNTDSGHCHCNGDRNATYKTCPNPCPPTCTNPQCGNPCYALCVPHGCECNPGFVLSDEGKCIMYQDCPGVLCNGDRNATYKQCPDPCPSTCALLGITRLCNKECLPYGCECNEGYHLNDEGKCIWIEDCPGALCNGDRNATFKECPNPCPRTCELPSGPEACIAICPPRGCECNEGYYLNDKGKCVQLQDCPGAKCCSANETFVYCKSGCPTDYCPVDDSRAIVACDQPFPCPSGCVCRGEYLKVSYEDETCILATECPPVNCTRPNEVWSKCPPACLQERCNDICQENSCDTRYHYCRPQCVCKHGFCRNDSDICVPKPSCPPLKCSCNETEVECKTTCPPQSCEISYTEYLCPNVSKCERGCDCLPNYLRNASGVCILNDECPPPPLKCSCNETEVECKTTCPPQSCEISYTEYLCPNVSKCERGCDCLPNYLRNASGVCILNDECPPPPLKCSCNETEVECKTTCPPQSCENSYTEYACPNVSICERGCDCLPNYLRNASGVCILNDECPPPLTCGEFEVPSSCKIKCPPQTCDSIFSTYICEDQTCEVGCDCIDGYLRNRLGDCIPSEECFLEPECDICEECRPTCSNPTPKDCPIDVEVPEENVDGCKCKEGYILSDIIGNCIEIGDCPDGCNDDPNAIVTACPWPCPSTCDSPNASSCGQKCKTVGCQCKPGFILSEKNGKCILPDDCECGNPCGINGTYSDCSFRCPNQYCPEDDSRSIVACKPGRPCPPGCMCKEYYRRTSYEDDTCILAQDCPVITCTRPSEVFDSCASECLAENCSDLQTTNNCVPDPKNCQPKCVCCEGHCRDEDGNCVPKDQCRPSRLNNTIE